MCICFTLQTSNKFLKQILCNNDIEKVNYDKVFYFINCNAYGIAYCVTHFNVQKNYRQLIRSTSVRRNES